MKKWISLFLALCLALGLCACGGNEQTNGGGEEKAAFQVGFGREKIMPETVARELTSAWATSSNVPPCSHAMAAPAAQPALTAPQ